MPPSVVKNKEDERLWDKAKDIAAEAGKKEEYDYVMGIFKKMNPDRFASLSPAFKLALRYASEEQGEFMSKVEKAADTSWATALAKKLAAEHQDQSFKTAAGGLADKIRDLAKHFLDRPYVRYNKGTLSFSERGAKPWAGSETYNIPELLASPRVKGMSGDMQDFLSSLHKLLLSFSGQEVEVPSNIAVAWLDEEGFTDQSSFNLDTEYNIDTHYDRRGFYASDDKTAAEPPMHMAAKADEALGEAYNSLVALKLGFDTWTEIPQSTLPLYNWIGKAISQVVTARQSTHQVREMVRQKKY